MPPKRKKQQRTVDLFPRLTEHEGFRRKRSYIRQELIRLASEGSLCVTDLFAQTPDAHMIAGMVILGHDREEGSHTGADVPPELAAYMVRVKSLNGQTIAYKMPWLRSDDVLYEEFGERSSVAVGNDEHKLARITQVRDLRETGETECEIPLKDAWFLLKERGRYCAIARTARQQKAKWTVEEVRPSKRPTVALSEADELAELRATVRDLQKKVEGSSKKPLKAATA